MKHLQTPINSCDQKDLGRHHHRKKPLKVGYRDMSYTACAEHTQLPCKEAATMDICLCHDLVFDTSSMSRPFLSPWLDFVSYSALDWWSW
jgi:hypothetical protein